MCGISGYIDFKNRSVDTRLLKKSIQYLKNRGPDDEGIWTDEAVGLAHTRLSIVDLTSSGRQPMLSSDGRYVCVFNGEIYNFQQLKQELEEFGVNWRGRSDTEVLLAAFSAWGPDFVERLDGMFAFAIWDRRERTAFLGRDRFGEKPLFYSWSNERFAFASRPEALKALMPSASFEYDQQGLRLFLESGYTSAPYSIYREVKKLPAATFLFVDASGLRSKRYWDLRLIPVNESWNRRSETDLLDELDEISTRAVASRMMGDVPVGAFLSGGLDSSLVVAKMMREKNHPVKTFTISFSEKAYDESATASKIASYLGTDHYSVPLQVNDLLKLLPEFLDSFDEPFFDSAAFPTMAVSKLAREHVKVSLTGDGGDEIFGGYHYYKIAEMLSPFYSCPSWLRSTVANCASVYGSHRAKLFAGALKQKSRSGAFAYGRSIAKDFSGVLSKEALADTKGLADIFEEDELHFPSGMSAAERGMRLDALHTLSEDYLQKTDMASMAYSLESRAPLLSRELVEWGMKLPIKWKIRNGTTKSLFRQLVFRHIPRELIDLPKRGFGVPIDTWLRGPLFKWAEERFLDPSYYIGLPIDQKKCVNLFRLHQTGKRNVHPLLWAILMLLEFNSRNYKHV